MSEPILLARQAAANGQWSLAEDLSARILAQAPLAIDALEVLAMAKRNLGDIAGAEAALERAIAAAPHKRWPFGDLVRLLLDAGRPAEAEATAWRALRADPTNADALMLLSRMELDRGLFPEAEGHIEAAIALVGAHPELLVILARATMLQNRLDVARDHLQQALAGGRASVETLALLAQIEERAGRFDLARTLLDQAEVRGRAEGLDVTLQRSVLLDRAGEPHQALELLERADGLSGSARLQRGRLRDKLGQYQAAWKDWASAKQEIAVQTGRSYPAQTLEEQGQALRKFAQGNGLVTGVDAPSAARSLPIFILGFPRSGTTLVEQIVAAHSAILAGGELPFGPELKDLAASKLGGEQALLDWLGTDQGPHLAHDLRTHYLTRAAGYGLCGGTSALFTDKMPLNEFWLPLIRLAFPDARIVRVQRHPLDVLVSAFSHDLTHGHNFAYRLDDAIRHIELIDRQMRCYAAAGLRIDHVLRYEDLVADQQEQTRALMESIGLDMEPAQLDFHRQPRIAPTPSYAQIMEPLNSRSVGRWRNYAEELAQAHQTLAPIIAAMGYAG